MAASIDFQRVTHLDAVVKVSGATGESATISLADDLLPQGQIAMAVGEIATVDSSDAVVGTDTEFTPELIGGKLYETDGKTYLGTVEDVTDATHLTLTENAASTWSGTFGASYTSQELDGDVQVAPIVAVLYAGVGVITISRNSVVVLTLNATGGNGKLDLATLMVPDKTEERSDIDISIDGDDAVCQVWLKLRKVYGWASRIETGFYGAHDDETKVGE